MLKWNYLWVATIVTLTFAGCGTLRSIEQWKCDNWGMCHFGTRPSQSLPAVPGGPAYDAYGAPQGVPSYPAYPSAGAPIGAGCPCPTP